MFLGDLVINKQTKSQFQTKKQKINKLLDLLLVSLLVCQATDFSLKLYDIDSGEDGEDEAEDIDYDIHEFNGVWSEESSTDQGEIVEDGDFKGKYYFFDNGEIHIAANYVQWQENLQDIGESIYETHRHYKVGKLKHVGLEGQLTKEEVTDFVLKRIRSKKN
ncbi:hypothetical protein TTHERM_00903900 (macronuclear) [Tetrahymena thermophila SB210]|uniref:Uncharacterized protein n=1 Tax=Tetrahymena thermophila (strain SB210) TaxID=312017 RepID=Q24GA7_TETTS|nr:hypothetical protein TTHERM_00903900 [Tetrahymena thermophila SB210]EAS06823.1 hypothetical protein TTHERM_00903900 [Tetrahymena thermophila SB210]|eukprot:XP_001027065.1 hypothetical protein TTHERM_00903900 [Tetrahymena thermophila SB210]